MLTATVVLTGIIFTGCEKKQINTNDNKTAKIPKFEIDKNIGVTHNEMVNLFIKTFNKKENKNKLTTIEKIEYFKQYCLETYDTDISSVTDALLSTVKNQDLDALPLYKNIDLIKSINNIPEDRFSPYFKQKMIEFYNSIEECNNDTSLMKQTADYWINNIENDNNFALNEIDYFTNMLFVFKSSVDYWYSYPFNGKPSNEYWKIAATDWAGGAIGAIGGPVGAAIGLFSSSVTTVINML